MPFVPIKLRDYLKLRLKSNPSEKASDLEAQLQSALADYRAGRGCQNCGAPIWVIGSAQVGLMCFTCITGETDPSGDYEIAEACDTSSHALDAARRLSSPSARSSSF